MEDTKRKPYRGERPWQYGKGRKPIPGRTYCSISKIFDDSTSKEITQGRYNTFKALLAWGFNFLRDEGESFWLQLPEGWTIQEELYQSKVYDSEGRLRIIDHRPEGAWLRRAYLPTG